jgi:hypothetical protein
MHITASSEVVRVSIISTSSSLVPGQKRADSPLDLTNSQRAIVLSDLRGFTGPSNRPERLG